MPRFRTTRFVPPVPVAVLAVCLIATLAVLVPATPARAQLGSLWRSIVGDDSVRPDKGFADFRTESRRIEEAVGCRRVVERAKDEFSDLRRHCVLGDNRTVRVTAIQPVGHEGLTKAVRLGWSDNAEGEARAIDAPPHVDRAAARAALQQVLDLYMPAAADKVLALFDGGGTENVQDGNFVAAVAHQPRTGVTVRSVEIRDGNYEALATSEADIARPGFEVCKLIISNIDVVKHLEIRGEPVPERQDLYLVYFLYAARGDKFLCELHDSGYYRIRAARNQGDSFRTLAHGNYR